ncbi:MAG: hypothetical protein AAB592_05595 [Patescibacteria group bacterium]
MELKEILAQKDIAKKSFVADMEKRAPLVGIDLSEVADDEMELWHEVAQGVSALGVPVVAFIAKGKTAPWKLPLLTPQERDGMSTYMPVDIIVLPSPSKRSQAFQNATVPVCERADDTHDFDPIKEAGNGFFYQNKNKWEIFAAIVRALETFRFPYDWKNVQKEGYRKVSLL